VEAGSRGEHESDTRGYDRITGGRSTGNKTYMNYGFRGLWEEKMLLMWRYNAWGRCQVGVGVRIPRPAP